MDERPPCGFRRYENGRARQPISLADSGPCDERAEYQVGLRQRAENDGRDRKSDTAILACAEHIEIASRVHPDVDPEVTPLRML